jgi:hypothetical protein
VYIIFSLHCLALWKTIWRLLIKLKIELPYDPEILLLGIYPNECKSRYNKDICTQMFIAALFTKPSYGNSPDALQLMNELRTCDFIYIYMYTYMQWNFILP